MTGDSVNISDYMLRTAEMIIRVAEVIDEEESRQFISEILSGRRIYVTGAGRSGLVAKAFAIRLMHLGFPCYVIGETITPAFDSGDMLVVFSGSGETKSVVSAAEKVRELEGWSCLITANPDSQAAGYVDLVIDLGESSGNSADLPPEYEVRQISGQYRSASVPIGRGSAFEMVAFAHSDAIISALMEARHLDPGEVRLRFSNI